MKINQQTQKVRSEGLGTTVKFSIDESSIDHIAYMLENQYTDPVLAVVREYAANAADAHQQAGIPETPIEIYVPSTGDATFKVRDFGPGLDETGVQKLLCGYGASGEHKRASDDFVGGMGIGAKVGFAISGQFQYTIWHEGTKSLWACYKDEFNRSTASRVHQESCNGETGVEVSVPVPSDRITDFKTAISKCFRYWPVKPAIYNAPSGGYTILSGEPVILSSTKMPQVLWELVARSRDEKPNIIMGGLSYPIQLDKLPFISRVEGKDRVWQQFRITAPVNFVQIAPSRESLVYSPYTLAQFRKIDTEFSMDTISTMYSDTLKSRLSSNVSVGEILQMYYATHGIGFPESVKRGALKQILAPYKGSPEFISEASGLCFSKTGLKAINDKAQVDAISLSAGYVPYGSASNMTWNYKYLGLESHNDSGHVVRHPVLPSVNYESLSCGLLGSGVPSLHTSQAVIGAIVVCNPDPKKTVMSTEKLCHGAMLALCGNQARLEAAYNLGSNVNVIRVDWVSAKDLVQHIPWLKDGTIKVIDVDQGWNSFSQGVLDSYTQHRHYRRRGSRGPSQKNTYQQHSRKLVKMVGSPDSYVSGAQWSSNWEAVSIKDADTYTTEDNPFLLVLPIDRFVPQTLNADGTYHELCFGTLNRGLQVMKDTGIRLEIFGLRTKDYKHTMEKGKDTLKYLWEHAADRIRSAISTGAITPARLETYRITNKHACHISHSGLLWFKFLKELRLCSRGNVSGWDPAIQVKFKELDPMMEVPVSPEAIEACAWYTTMELMQLLDDTFPDVSFTNCITSEDKKRRGARRDTKEVIEAVEKVGEYADGQANTIGSEPWDIWRLETAALCKGSIMEWLLNCWNTGIVSQFHESHIRHIMKLAAAELKNNNNKEEGP